MFFEKLKVLYNFISFKRQKFEDVKKLQRWQSKNLSKTLHCASKNFNYFREHKKKSFKNWPQIDKNSFLHSYNHLNKLNLSLDKARIFAEDAEKSRNFMTKYHGYTIGISSGTTGQRMPFIINDKERSMWAGAILAKILRTSIFKNLIFNFTGVI